MALDIRSISKRFGPVQANDSISLTIEPGTLHAVLGENGAGKSTLMKILSGFQGADDGEVRLDGAKLELGSPRRAIAAGIGMLHQDPLVALPLSVLENFLFGRPDRMNRADGRRTLGEIAGRLGFNLDPDRVTRTLSIGERQQLEIVRLLSLGVRVLILDEPTSGITTDQRVELFAALRRLASEGLIVLFVSHKLEEVEMLCSSVTVIRRGAVTGEASLPCPEPRLIEMMFGRLVAPADRPAVELGEPVVEVSGLSSKHGRQRIDGADLTLLAGEVLGLAGLEGSGQLPLLRALAGLERPVSGSVHVNGRDLTHASLRDHISAGIHFLPAGRLEEGLFPGLTISEHLSLAHPGSGLDRAVDQARAEAAIGRYRIKGTPTSSVDGLSGGNQQRVLLAMMPERLVLLLMEQPTRGLDIESADMVWSQILSRRDHGTAIVFASADLDELVRYSDRIAVCFDGRIISVDDARGLDSDRLGARIGGRVAS
jgi:simple sugar transport system ATP-binding protein